VIGSLPIDAEIIGVPWVISCRLGVLYIMCKGMFLAYNFVYTHILSLSLFQVIIYTCVLYTI